jgi:hypothetical protein
MFSMNEWKERRTLAKPPATVNVIGLKKARSA